MYQVIAAHIRNFGAVGVHFFESFVFPPTCAGCNCAGTWMCEMCTERLVDLRSSADHFANQADYTSVSLRARFAYEGPVRSAIHRLKYEGERARSEWFAEQLEPLLNGTRTASTILEPVPLTPRRERHRGFNQSYEIALRLSQSTGVILGDHIERVRETRPQVELSGLERITNVRGAFQVRSKLDGRQVVLVDDVITTGATMRECALACYEAGAANVIGLAVAMAANARG